jgi:hypothetical protein
MERNFVLPEKQSGVISRRLPDGRMIVVIPTPTLIDARGVPLADDSP